jgi:bifunctional UDP-N-acetylglucosamine pyrophosphorylase/glucosamine-1-phosphate N-acetyltransferase
MVNKPNQTTQAGSRLSAVVLAAGFGKRMHSEKAKVLHGFLGKPMIFYPVDAALKAGVDQVTIVVGHQKEAVETYLKDAFPNAPLVFVQQSVPKGTGDAARCARQALDGFDEALFLCGDTPNLDAGTLCELIALHRREQPALTLTSFDAPDPTGYGRIERKKGGHIEGIIEHRDASEKQRKITEVNAGLYLARTATFWDALDQVDSQNDQGEIYLTDVVGILATAGTAVTSFHLAHPWRLEGINSRTQLAELERQALHHITTSLMDSGVTLEDPQTLRIETGVEVGRDTVIGAHVELRGHTKIGQGCRIETGCVLQDTILADRVHLKPYVVADHASLATDTVAGPFAHLRPDTVLSEGARVGNFVETKKTTLGPGSKANHLSYLGDCEIGKNVNVGAGTITCNYDGTHKHRTVLEDEVFIGSDTQLVAPVRVGRRATVAAGTTVTKDVPAGSLALSRSPQVNKEGYDERWRKPREAQKKKKES